MEVMDQGITIAVENYVNVGYPRDAGAVLLAEVDGLLDGVDIDAQRISDIGRQHGATDVRQAAPDEERMLLWKGRKTAFGAVAQIAPNYYLHDTVVPRSKLADTLEEVYRIADEHDLAGERFPCRRWKPASAAALQRPRTGNLRSCSRRWSKDR